MSDGLDVKPHFTALLDIAASTGLFDHVAGYEPKSAPGSGLTVSLWGASIIPVQSSGLDKISVRLELQLRVHKSMLAEPQEDIDPAVLNAAGVLMGALAGGYTLNGEARAVDLLGAEGEQLRAEAGYLSIDGKMFRVMDVFCPTVIDDVWTVAG